MTDVRVVVYGGAGQLGKVICSSMAAMSSSRFIIYSVDIAPSSQPCVTDIVITGKTEEMANDIKTIQEKLGKEPLDAVICVAGGFQWGGENNIQQIEVFAQYTKMMAFNANTALMASHLAANCLKKGGVLVLTGAEGARNPTPMMIGYGMAKAATHHLIRSLQAGNPTYHVTALLPVMLDTPQNRGDMPNADTSTWTKLVDVARELISFARNPEVIEKGKVATLVTKADKTTLEWSELKDN